MVTYVSTSDIDFYRMKMMLDLLQYAYATGRTSACAEIRQQCGVPSNPPETFEDVVSNKIIVRAISQFFQKEE